MSLPPFPDDDEIEKRIWNLIKNGKYKSVTFSKRDDTKPADVFYGFYSWVKHHIDEITSLGYRVIETATDKELDEIIIVIEEEE